MSEVEFGGFSFTNETESGDGTNLIEKIEEAYRLFKQAEGNLNDVSSDYGEFKIAKLQLKFTRHELISLLKEADNKGVKWDKDEFVKDFLSAAESEDALRSLEEDSLENNEQ